MLINTHFQISSSCSGKRRKMVNLSGYEIIEQIFKSHNSTIYRGCRNSDGCSVIIKTMNNEYPGIEELAGFRREFQILSSLSGDKIIKVYDIIENKNSLAIILEDIKGKVLSEHIKTDKLSMTEKLMLSINLTDAIDQIHKQGIIHKDINPSNIVWNINNNQLRIIDFGISTELSKEKFQNSSFLEGTVPYISPEQTGKINRVVDYRSDFYSLGITFYEIFTGLTPFTGDDLKIIYSHIAIPPKEPCIISKDIPSSVSKIIIKLLAKNADDRYQSIHGLKYDLLYCLENIDNEEKIKSFKTAQKDTSDRFQIPQKLYGREFDIEHIIKTFDESLNKKIRVLLISGYSGIGKTSVVKEINKLLVDRNYIYTSGKFSQLERNKPYSAIISAFRVLIENLVLEYKNIEMWKSSLSDALGSNGKIMLDLIPGLRNIIGDQPEIPLLNPVEEKNRFQIVFRNFIKVFAKKKHPLVIFLDDLQWSDFSSIDFLKYLLTSIDVNNLLIIGAYRDNEVPDGHHLINMIEELKSIHGNSKFLNHIVLEPLHENIVNKLISDTLKRKPKDTFHLSNLIYRKTKGNPFFVNQLLISIYQKGGFRFNENEMQWDWNLSEIEQLQISTNVVEFLVAKLKELPENALAILKNASCLGNCFDLKTLYLISDKSISITDALWLTIVNDFIVPVNYNYKFLHMPKDDFLKSDIEIKFRFSHDRVQQACYSLISDSDKMLIHKNIGRILSDIYTSHNNFDTYIFEVVNHLNIARGIIDNKKERIELAKLNYKAGIKAKTNSAYEIAHSYLLICKGLLFVEEWKCYPENYFNLIYELTETIFLSGNLPVASKECELLLDAASNDIDRARVHALNAKILDFSGDKREVVIDEIRKGLLFLGVSLPCDFNEIDEKFKLNMEKLKLYLENSKIDDLVNLAEMTDENKIMIMKLLFQVQAAAFQHYPPLNFLIQLIMFNMELTYGTTDLSCKNFAEFGIVLGSILGNYEMAYQSNKVAFTLLEKYRAKSLEAGCYYIFATFISHWRVHYSESLNYYDLSIKRGVETGDMWHASFSCSHKVHLNLYTGLNLDSCKSEAENAIKFLKNAKVSLLVPMVDIFLHTVNQLQSNYNFKKENSMLEEFIRSNNMVLLCNFGVNNLIINYLLGNVESAEKWDRFTDKYLQGETGFFSIPDHYMFQSLLMISKYKNADVHEKEVILDVVTNNIKQLKNWSDNCPSNYLHKYFLVSAEFARIKNESLDVITTFYKKALTSISSGDFVHMKALINELIGEFWLSKDEELISKTYIKEAHYFYKLWGALSKVKIIEDRFRKYFPDNNRIETEMFSSEQKSSTSKFSHVTTLDLKYILKATQSISVEIKKEKLFNVLMRIITECTGAQKGCLILKHMVTGNLYIETVKRDDSDDIDVLKSIPLYECDDLCQEIVLYVAGTLENIVLSDAKRSQQFQNCKYIITENIKSLLCMPVIHKNSFMGIIYLENNLMENVFTSGRVNTLKIILLQIASSIEHARHYECLEEMVKEKNAQLEKVKIEHRKSVLLNSQKQNNIIKSASGPTE